MKLTCPNNPQHKRFSVTAHVAQDWEVDESGTFVAELDSMLEVTHYPDQDDLFECLECGTTAEATP